MISIFWCDFLNSFYKIEKYISFMEINFTSIGAEEQKVRHPKHKMNHVGQQRKSLKTWNTFFLKAPQGLTMCIKISMSIFEILMI